MLDEQTNPATTNIPIPGGVQGLPAGRQGGLQAESFKTNIKQVILCVIKLYHITPS
jgi:hypothetical protein